MIQAAENFLAASLCVNELNVAAFLAWNDNGTEEHPFYINPAFPIHKLSVAAAIHDTTNYRTE
jgi:hypothetical protein